MSADAGGPRGVRGRGASWGYRGGGGERRLPSRHARKRHPPPPVVAALPRAGGAVARCQGLSLPASVPCRPCRSQPRTSPRGLAVGHRWTMTGSRCTCRARRGGSCDTRQLSHLPPCRLGASPRARGALPELPLVHASGGHLQTPPTVSKVPRLSPCCQELQPTAITTDITAQKK